MAQINYGNYVTIVISSTDPAAYISSVGDAVGGSCSSTDLQTVNPAYATACNVSTQSTTWCNYVVGGATPLVFQLRDSSGQVPAAPTPIQAVCASPCYGVPIWPVVTLYDPCNDSFLMTASGNNCLVSGPAGAAAIAQLTIVQGTGNYSFPLPITTEQEWNVEFSDGSALVLVTNDQGQQMLGSGSSSDALGLMFNLVSSTSNPCPAPPPTPPGPTGLSPATGPSDSPATALGPAASQPRWPLWLGSAAAAIGFFTLVGGAVQASKPALAIGFVAFLVGLVVLIWYFWPQLREL